MFENVDVGLDVAGKVRVELLVDLTFDNCLSMVMDSSDYNDNLRDVLKGDVGRCVQC